MKKIIIAASMLAVAFTSNAQDATTTTSSAEPIKSKRGYAILPEAGDYALSATATPLVNYMGNLLSNAGNNTATNPFNSFVITGKKFIDANTAYRVMVGINLTSNSKTNLVNDDLNTTTEIKTVEDKRSISNSAVTLGAGLEKRRGTSRLQGVYGAMARITLGNINGAGSSKFTYGNAFSAANGSPTHTTNFDNGNTSSIATSRVLSTKGGFAFGVAVLGFVGVEYFFAPKISIGAEYQWGPSFNLQGKGATETETFDGTVVKTVTTETGGNSSFGLGTGNVGLNLNLHF